jgi:hypothetical protein
MYDIVLPAEGKPRSWGIVELQGHLQTKQEDLANIALGALELRSTVGIINDQRS